MEHWAPRGRRSIRLRSFDYAAAGAYFVTMCTEGRAPLFGRVEGGTLHLSRFGLIVEEEWLKTPRVRRSAEIDAFVVMPNHFHGIVWFASPEVVGAHSCAPLRPQNPMPIRRPRSLGSLVAQFKATVARSINLARGTPGAPVWQRNYYDHIIRDERALEDLRTYIEGNPATWADDPENAAMVPRRNSAS